MNNNLKVTVTLNDNTVTKYRNIKQFYYNNNEGNKTVVIAPLFKTPIVIKNDDIYDVEVFPEDNEIEVGNFVKFTGRTGKNYGRLYEDTIGKIGKVKRVNPSIWNLDYEVEINNSIFVFTKDELLVIE